VRDEVKKRPLYWTGLMFCVPFSALTLTAGWQEGHRLSSKAAGGGEGPQGIRLT